VFERYRDIQERRHSGEAGESGFTLVELLIVIVVLGILAAIVVFSLTGVTGQSKAAACTSDGKTVEIAADAFQATTGSYPTQTSDLVGQYLHSWPSSTAYTISLGSNTVNVAVGTGSAVPYTSSSGCSSL